MRGANTLHVGTNGNKRYVEECIIVLQKVETILENYGFQVNPYDACVANK